jgi:tetratricopeptide (TPR) repeat protein
MVRVPRFAPRSCGALFSLATVALLGSATVVFGQMELAVIQGTVVDDQDGNPLPDVTIRMQDLQRGRETVVKTDKSGRFYRRGMQAVDYEITVQAEGYQPIQDKIDLKAGVDNRFTFRLAKAAPLGAEEFQQGVAAFNKGDFQAAANAFQKAIQKAPTIPDLYVNLALAYFRLDRTAEAATQLEKAASLASDDPKIQYQLGSAYVDMQNYDQAIAAFEKGLATNPDLATDPLALEATSTLGAVYFAQGDNEKAEALFQKALAAKPGAAGATLGMAKVHFSKGNVKQALQLFEQVVATHPGTPEATQAEAFIKELRKSKPPGGLTTSVCGMGLRSHCTRAN